MDLHIYYGILFHLEMELRIHKGIHFSVQSPYLDPLKPLTTTPPNIKPIFIECGTIKFSFLYDGYQIMNHFFNWKK